MPIKLTSWNLKKNSSVLRWTFAIFLLFISLFSFAQNSIKETNVEFNSVEKSLNSKSENSKKVLFVTSGATLITSSDIQNVEIVIIPEKEIITELKNKRLKVEKTEISEIVKVKNVRVEKVEKPKSQIHFHSLPSSQALLVNNLLKVEIAQTQNPNLLFTNSSYSNSYLNFYSSSESSLYLAEQNLISYLDSILARPPPTL